MTTPSKHWLLKAEPDSRIVKKKDVKFSVDDFERVTTSPWEGVRNYEARNLMKEMKEGEKALFYHSNCKTPGIAAFAEISKEAYPDYTAWDPQHPYYDPNTDSDAPKWFMVDLTFKSRATHFVPLSLLRYISDLPGVPEEIAYVGEQGFSALKGMDLVRKGRLSVQRVTEEAWNAIKLLAEKGGWEEMDLKPRKPKGKARASSSDKAPKPRAKKAKKQAVTDEEGEEAAGNSSDQVASKAPANKLKVSSVKRKRDPTDLDGQMAAELGLRRSTRTKNSD